MYIYICVYICFYMYIIYIYININIYIHICKCIYVTYPGEPREVRRKRGRMTFSSKRGGFSLDCLIGGLVRL